MFESLQSCHQKLPKIAATKKFLSLTGKGRYYLDNDKECINV